MLRFRIATGGLQSAKADGILVCATRKGERAIALHGLSESSPAGKEILAQCAATAFRARAGEVILATSRRIGRPVFVAGLGEHGATSVEDLRRAAGTAVWKVRDAGVGSLAMALPGLLDAEDEAAAATEGSALGAYRFTTYKSDPQSHRDALKTITLLVSGRQALADAKRGAARGELWAEGVNLARDWANKPAGDKTPRVLAQAAKSLQGGPVTCSIWDEKEIKKRGMGAFLGVAAGSDEPPRFIHLRYRPKGKPKRKIGIVGKGITFDSGGLSLKGAKDMEEMKYDMAGAAAVLGVFRILPRMDVQVEVHGVVAATENLPSGHATRPGDVLRSYSGKTIEVLNTDAEGRLTLADALAYTVEQGVDEIVDLATLTGACMVGLGASTGMFGRPQWFVDRVMDAARSAGDRSWQLPLFDDYRSQIRSEVADIKNTGGRWGGAITAALFLDEFVPKKLPWIHMDIAGSAWGDKDVPYLRGGATGTGVRTLAAYLTRVDREGPYAGGPGEGKESER